MKQIRKKKSTPVFLGIAAMFAAALLLAMGFWLQSDVRKKDQDVSEHAKIQEETEENVQQESREPEAAMEETETEPDTGAEIKPEAEDEETSYVSPVDFEELWAINEDVVAWIKIPDTRIDYPILQGRDNEQYLHTDIEGNNSVAGAIYLDMDDEPDFSSLHNILYGHHMKNGTMFKDVVFYKEQDFFDEHQDIYIYTPQREIHLKALAALYTSADGIRRRTRFYSGRALDDYVRKMTADAVTRAKSPGPVHRLYSLITCSYEFPDARTILYAYEVDE